MSNSKPQTIVDCFTSWYMKRLKATPITTKALTSATLSFTSNIIAQGLIERKKIDWSRVIKFTIWGLISSPVGHFWHIILDRLFRNIKDKYQVVGKLLADQLIFAPFINILFYTVLALLDGKPGAILIKLYFDLFPTSQGFMEGLAIGSIHQFLICTISPSCTLW
ncbi:pmp22 family protein [Heterostelium album PN500]|uniref:Pmp22 family protein n=1 Tax=Heterostelium pallidum (strain ATCC 26659 / Pp 5 / PN500) TaxID=670386 RepID=D3BJL5_HETP5|nr:pmp22 family protein [Heterostelium album PN500]EFA78095.1 pmp22 family protein [Heterostelium album PN500]|eukprot:XP_020430222.1 pmp22 family protein [Heterostelium album PN500]